MEELRVIEGGEKGDSEILLFEEKDNGSIIQNVQVVEEESLSKSSEEIQYSPLPSPKKGLAIVKFVIASAIAVASDILYYQATKGEPLITVFSGVFSTYLINTYGGEQTLSFIEEKLTKSKKIEGNNDNKHEADENSLRFQNFAKIIIVLIADLLFSLPPALATFSVTQGSTPYRLTLGITNYIGNLPLYGLAFSLVMEEELPFMIWKMKEWIRVVFLRLKVGTNHFSYQEVWLLSQIHESLIDSLTSHISVLRSSDFVDFPLHISHNPKEMLLFLINQSQIQFQHKQNPSSSSSSSSSLISSLSSSLSLQRMWSRLSFSTQYTIRRIAHIMRTVIGICIGVTLIIGVIGYTCDSKVIVEEITNIENETINWAAGLFFTGGLFYLSVKGGWELSTQFLDWIGMNIMYSFTVPVLWKLYGKLSLLLMLIPIIALYSGYTDQVIYDGECPWSEKWQPFADMAVYWTTNAFLASFVYLSVVAGGIGFVRLFGSKEKRIYIEKEEEAQRFLLDLERGFPASLIVNVLSDVDVSTRSFVLNEVGMIAWNRYFHLKNQSSSLVSGSINDENNYNGDDDNNDDNDDALIL